MKTITAFETSDGKRFFDAGEARDYEKRNGLIEVVRSATMANPLFARLDTQLLIAFLMKHGPDISHAIAGPTVRNASYTEDSHGKTIGIGSRVRERARPDAITNIVVEVGSRGIKLVGDDRWKNAADYDLVARGPVL